MRNEAAKTVGAVTALVVLFVTAALSGSAAAFDFAPTVDGVLLALNGLLAVAAPRVAAGISRGSVYSQETADKLIGVVPADYQALARETSEQAALKVAAQGQRAIERALANL